LSRSLVFTDPPSTEIYTLSLHDALPISYLVLRLNRDSATGGLSDAMRAELREAAQQNRQEFAQQRAESRDFQSGLDRQVSELRRDRKSTRLNSSHVKISYAVFCLKKKKR